MKTNKKATAEVQTTFGGAKTNLKLTPGQQLRRSVLCNMLFENEFYEDGVAIANRITDLIPSVPPDEVAAIAIEARSKYHLRHVPLLLCAALVKIGKLESHVLDACIQRPDEIAEFLSLYAKVNNREASTKPLGKLARSVVKGIGNAFRKFNEYSLAKYNQKNAIKLRDAMRLCRPKPDSAEQSSLWKRLLDDKLATPETWEVLLSAGHDKKETFEYLIREGKLGGLALLRNLRNCQQANISKDFMREAFEKNEFKRVLPMRFLSAARAVPAWEDIIEPAMLRVTGGMDKLQGHTTLILDVSGSMGRPLSSKSDLNRLDTACSIATLLRELCIDITIFATAGNDHTEIHRTEIVPPRHGFALIDQLHKSFDGLGGGGIFLTQCCDYAASQTAGGQTDRLIVITDEVDCDHRLTPDKAKAFGSNNYLINIASTKVGIGYGKWLHIDGFSEAVIDYIVNYEQAGYDTYGQNKFN